MKSQMLLGDQTRADTRSQMGIQEARHVVGVHISPTFEEPARKDWNRVCMCLHEFGKYLSKLVLLFQCSYLSFLEREKG